LNGAEHTNFFENRSTEYSKASTQGTWEDVFSGDVFDGKYGVDAKNETNMSNASGDNSGKSGSVAAE
jgi:ribonucleoside-diphosphate reductase beta chain